LDSDVMCKGNQAEIERSSADAATEHQYFHEEIFFRMGFR